MMTPTNKSLPMFLIFMFLWTKVNSVQFEVLSGHTKCIAEDIKSQSMTVGKYHIVNPNQGHPLPDTHKVIVRVTSTHGNTYHYADNVLCETSVGPRNGGGGGSPGHSPFRQWPLFLRGILLLETAEAGDYMACFYAADHKPPITLTIDFDWKSSVAAKDWSNVVKKGSVDGGRNART